MRIRAFQGLRPEQSIAAKVASPPYDVVSRKEVRKLCSDNPLSMLHIIRAEADLPSSTNPQSDSVYEKALSNYEKFQRDGHLIREAGPSLYLYRLEMEGHCQVGLAALCHVDDYESGLVKKHENTRPEKVDDRTRLALNLNAHTGPVLLAYHDEAALASLAEEVMTGIALFDFTCENGIRHTVWRIPEGQTFIQAFENVRNLYVADGHHRIECAARVRLERQQANPQHSGAEDYNWFLAVMFPSSQLKILPYNRVIGDLNSLSADEFLKRVSAVCEVEKVSNSHPEHPADLRMYLQGQWYGIRLDPKQKSDLISRLDVSLLQEIILEPILGVKDQRTDPRIDFVGGRDAGQAVAEKVESSAGAVGFSLYPVTVEQLLEIADASQIMPPKSTWFEPKLRSGLFIHTF